MGMLTLFSGILYVYIFKCQIYVYYIVSSLNWLETKIGPLYLFGEPIYNFLDAKNEPLCLF